MTWGKVDDKLHSHRKTASLGAEILPAMGLWALGLSWSSDALTDGFIPTGQPARLAGRPVGRLIKALVAAGFWEVAPGGWLMHDFHDHNPEAVVAIAKRAARTTAKVTGGRARAAGAARIGGRFTSSAPAEPPAAHQQSTSPVPVPSLSVDRHLRKGVEPRRLSDDDLPAWMTA